MDVGEKMAAAAPDASPAAGAALATAEEQEGRKEPAVNASTEAEAPKDEAKEDTSEDGLSEDVRYDTLALALDATCQDEDTATRGPMDVDGDGKLARAGPPSSSSGAFLEGIPNALSSVELVKRRKDKVSQLIAMYKEQYWLLADELCARVQKFEGRRGEGNKPATSAAEKSEDMGAPAKQYPSVEAYYSEKGRSSTSKHQASGSAQDQGGDPGQGCGEGAGAVPLPSFSDLEEDILSHRVRLSPDQVEKQQMLRRRKAAAGKLSTMKELEKTAQSIFSRRANKKGALACLVGKQAHFYLSRPEASLGRKTKFQLVDIDLSMEGKCTKVSRQQGMIRMHAGGSFYFQNFGQRKVRVDNAVVPYKRRAVLQNGSFLDVGGLRFIFLINPIVTAKQL